MKCGVKLQDGETVCPLCGLRLPVIDETGDVPHATYSSKYPKERLHEKYLGLGLSTAILIAACLVCLIACLKSYGAVSWSGYVMLGSALLWTVMILPSWFRTWRPFVFVPVDFVALGGYLLYICLYTGGHWFLSFAFPLLGIFCLISMGAYTLYRYCRMNRLYITAGLLVVVGCSCMLIELFQHITFGTPMFVWSLYCVCVFGAAGLFLLAAAIIPPLRNYLERKFFL